MLDKIKKFEFVIQGISPLLTNNPQAMRNNGNGGPGPINRVYDDLEEAEVRAYRTANGECAVPSIMIRNTIMNSAAFLRIKRIPLKQYIAHIQIEPGEFLVLLDPQTRTPLTTFEVNVQRCVVQKAAIMRARPLFRNWAVEFAILADTELLPDAHTILAAQLAEAGSRIGIGDYRPQKGGPFGRFTVVE